MKRQKGQSIVEFAIVFPFFMFLLMAVIYTGMLFADYLTLSNITRDSVRLAAIGTTEQNIRTYKKDVQLITNLYSWSSMDTDAFKIGESSVSGDDCMVVTSTATCTQSSDFTILYLTFSLPKTITIQYSMHKET